MQFNMGKPKRKEWRTAEKKPKWVTTLPARGSSYNWETCYAISRFATFNFLSVMVAKALVVTPPFCQPDRVFAAMFQSNGMRESTTGRVDIKDRIFLNDCSTTFTPSKSRRYCPKRSLFVAADMYGIADLKEKCIQLLVPFIGWTIRSRYWPGQIFIRQRNLRGQFSTKWRYTGKKFANWKTERSLSWPTLNFVW